MLYEAEEGSCPFSDWFDRLDAPTALRVRTNIARIEAGNFGDVKPVGSGVSERRIDFGLGYRIYFGREGGRVVVLLVGGTKKRRDADIVKAKVCWADYRRRKKEN